MKLTPFLLFDGSCAEAVTFYQSCLGGTLTITTVGETPLQTQLAPEHHGKVAYAHLVSGALEFSATDWLHPTRAPQPGNTVAMYVDEGSYDELRPIFDALGAGGAAELRDELQDLPFGTYGHLADRFGVHWFFHGASSP